LAILFDIGVIMTSVMTVSSLHKDPRGKSPYFYCAYRAADGRRLFKSTKKTKRADALEVCLGWAMAEKEAAEGRLTEARAREIISETVRRATGSPLQFKTTRQWVTDWLKGKTASGELSKRSEDVYEHAVRRFLESIGEMADKNLANITAEHIQHFKVQRISEGLAAKTLDRDLKILRSIFKAARVFGLISFDPTQAIPLLTKLSKRKSQVMSRETFTPSELDSIIEKAEPEWKTLILLARYTGARQGDCARMTWENVDLEKGIIEFSDQKTNKDYKVPLHPRLEKHLLELASSDDPKGALCPTLSKKPSAGASGLSNGFKKIMVLAEIDDRQESTKSIKAVEGKARQLSRRSFHSIRHSYNSELANSGASQEIRRKLVGHATDDMNDVYTHLDLKLFRKAIKKLS
jgi:integrase